jgi:hypothetical protein
VKMDVEDGVREGKAGEDVGRLGKVRLLAGLGGAGGEGLGLGAMTGFGDVDAG